MRVESPLRVCTFWAHLNRLHLHNQIVLNMTLIDINEFSNKKTSIKLYTLDFYLCQPNEGGQGNFYCPYTAGWN